MEEKKLLRLSLIFSLFGILVLFLISLNMDVNEKLISQLDETDLGFNVKMEGVVTDVQNKGTVTLITISQLDEMDVVLFNSELILNKGDYLEVTGKIDEYEGKNQIIADKIVLK
jgi:DNA/RNA endonuclease YhcR with UshA esterase domain